MKLNQRMIERAKPDGRVRRIGDGQGLYLEIRDGKRGTHKHFVFRATIDGAVTEIRLGKYPWLTLEAARDLAYEHKRAIRRGEDPRIQNRAEKPERKTTPTLRHCIEESFKVRMATAKDGGKALYQKQQFVERNAAPLLARPVNSIDPGDVVDVLRPIWGRPSAKFMRGDMRRVFDWATAAGYCTAQNPAGDCIAAMLPRTAHKSEPRKAIEYPEMPELLRKVESCSASLVNRLAWMFMAHTVCRAKEVLGAQWSEIDLEAKTFTVPSSRMKTGKVHVIPLNAEAVRIVELARELGSDTYLFPSPYQGGKRPISADGLTAVREAVGIKDRMDNHGVRAVFKTWAITATKFRREDVEPCLAHKIALNDVEQAYIRGDLLDPRRAVMEAYCRFLTGAQGEKVVPIRA